MRKIFRNKKATASPIEFSLATFVFITSYLVVTVSMSPAVEMTTLKEYYDAESKTVEMTQMLMSPNSEIGLAVDPSSPVSLPDQETPITETTIQTFVDLDVTSIQIQPENPNPEADPPDDPAYPDIDIIYTVKNIGSQDALGGFGVTIDIYEKDSTTVVQGLCFQISDEIDYNSQVELTSRFTLDEIFYANWENEIYSYDLVLTVHHANDIEPNNDDIQTDLIFSSGSENSPPSVKNPSPQNEQIDIPIEPSPTLEITVSDPDDDNLVVSFYNANTNQIIGSPHNVDLQVNDKVSQIWDDVNNYNTEYFWKVEASDGTDTTISKDYSFTTESEPTGNTPPTCQWVPPVPDKLPIGFDGDFVVTGNDPDPNEQIYIEYDWGDGLPALPVGPEKPDVNGDYTHMEKKSWPVANTYSIKARAYDGENFGDWTATVEVKVTNIAVFPNKCFLDDTSVLMSDNSWKNIQDINVGDKIKSYDINNSRYVNDVVQEIYHYKKENMGFNHYLVINDDLRVTPDHPFYINKRWIRAENLGLINKEIGVNLFSIEKVFSKEKHYNLHTQKYHNYIVRNDDMFLIAHNGQRKYEIGSYEEDVYTGGYKSASKDNTVNILHLNNIDELDNMDYNYLKDEVFDLPFEYNFIIRIENKNSQFLNKDDSGVDLDSIYTYASNKEKVVITDGANYASADLEVIIFS